MALCLLTVAFGVLHLVTGEIARGAVFAVAGTVSLVANLVVAARRSGSGDRLPARAPFAGNRLSSYLLRWAFVAGIAGAALCSPVLLNGVSTSTSLFGWLLFAAGLTFIYLALKVLALWWVARSIPSATSPGEQIRVMCSGRQPGMDGVFGKGVVLAATDRRLIAATTSWHAGVGYRSLAHSKLGDCEVDVDCESHRLTLRGPTINVVLVAVHPECAQSLARAVRTRARG